jgi:hypothetical protein
MIQNPMISVTKNERVKNFKEKILEIMTNPKWLHNHSTHRSNRQSHNGVRRGRPEPVPDGNNRSDSTTDFRWWQQQ